MSVEAPRIKEDVTYNLSEHEVLLSFPNDSDAESFRDWWDKIEEETFLMECDG